MADNESKLAQSWAKFVESLNEQEWYQQGKAKWEELDPQSRQYLKWAGMAVAALGVVFMIFSSIANVRGLRRELNDKSELLTMIQSANDELRRLKDANAGAGMNASDASGPWSSYLESLANGAGIDPAAMTVAPEKPGSSSETVKESLIDISLKKVNIRQVVRYAFGLESGSRPVKLRNLTIDTNMDPAGYMDATLSVSGFNLVTK